MASNTTKSHHPQDEASFISKVMLWSIFPLLWKGFRSPLQQEDLHQVSDGNSSGKLTRRLEEKWKEEAYSAQKRNRTARLWRAMVYFFTLSDYMKFLTLFVCQTVGCNITWYSLFQLMNLINNFSAHEKSEFREEAEVCLYGLLLGPLMYKISLNHFNLLSVTLGNKAKSGVIGLLYKKVLRLSKVSLDGGHVMELICNDSQRLVTSGEWHIPNGIRSVLYGVNIVVWLIYFIGWQIVPGIFFLLALAMLRLFCNKVDYDLRKRASQLSDERLGYIRQALSVIQTVKVNCWENFYEDTIRKIRWQEIKLKTKRWLISLICYSFLASSQSLATYTTVVTLLLTERDEIPKLNFFAMIYLYFNLSTAFVLAFSTAVRLVNDTRGALQRIELFLQRTECPKDKNTKRHTNDIADDNGISFGSNITKGTLESKVMQQNSTSLQLRNQPYLRLHDVSCQLPSYTRDSSTSFEENRSELHLLKNIELERSAPGLVLICGPVGSGKSSLLASILDQELLVTNGYVTYSGKVAFVSDSPCLFPGTIRENILFGSSFKPSKYNEAIKVCQLERDLSSFPEYDMTRVGEHGATVSGGQRTRIALARAVYFHADIYLLDDPLSSLDINVADNVYRECIRGILADRIVLLTTHATKYMREAEHIVQMENGAILAQGNFDAVKTKFQLAISDDDQRGAKQDQKSSLHEVWSRTNELVEAAGQREDIEDRNVGNVSWRVYMEYFLYGAPPLVLLLIPVIFFSGEGLIVLVDIIASRLPKSNGNESLDHAFLLYSVSLLAAVMLLIVGTLCVFLLLMNAAYKVKKRGKRGHVKPTGDTPGSDIIQTSTHMNIQ